MDQIVEFVQSLGLIGYVVIGIVFLCILNIKKIMTLRSPLDSWQHRAFQRTGGVMNPDHLDKKYIVKDVKSHDSEEYKDKSIDKQNGA